MVIDESSPLFSHVDPVVIWSQASVSDEQNALFPWREAVAELAQVDKIDELTDWFGECDCQEPTCRTCHRISQQEFDEQVRHVLQANQPALERFQAGLDRTAFQIEVAPPRFDDERFSMQEMRKFSRFLKLQALLRLHDGKLEDAVSTTEKMSQYAQIFARGGLFVQFQVSQAVQGVALAQIEELAEAGANSAELNRLVAVCEGAMGDSEMADALRREYCRWTFPYLEKFGAIQSIDEQIDQFIKDWFVDWGLISPDEVSTKYADRIAQRRAQIRYLLVDHPCPWDTAMSVRDSSAQVAAQIGALSTGSSLPEGSNSVDSWWPTGLGPWVTYEVMGESADAQQARDKLAHEMGMPPEELTIYNPLTPAQLAEYRDQLRQVDNPLGKLLCANHAPGIVEMTRNLRTERVAGTRQKIAQSTAVRRSN